MKGFKKKLNRFQLVKYVKLDSNEFEMNNIHMSYKNRSFRTLNFFEELSFLA